MTWPPQTPPPRQHPHPGPGWQTVQPYDARYVPALARPNPTPRPGMRRWVVAGVIATVFALFALAFALFFSLSFGIIATLLGLVFALIPVGIVVPIFVWLDRFEAEPWRYLLTAFLWGALAATLPSLVFNTAAMVIVSSSVDATSAEAFSAVVVAPVVEETFKGLFLLVMLWFRRHEFNGLADGVTYAGICAAGFAFTENILYLARAYTEIGSDAFVATFVLRGIISPFCHPMFTAMTGIGVGMAASSRSTGVKVVAPFVGWCAAVLLHALWNLSAVSGPYSFLLAYGVGMLLFFAFIGFIIWARAREGRIIGQFLVPYVQTGWLAPGEVSMLSSMSQRREARSWARARTGARGVDAMRAFQDTASELALLRARMYHHRVDQQAIASERVLLDSMTARRREFVGYPGR
ncbi:PrsW family intramembrane metalloprotease [Marihabitans asiaticum]|uniref:RsiW-degrading membrane proteinase PrsW (M82 family) n=1 Tax=Marihabitans asiaticum TaxID=415218 RepID=A0A560W873_9MICO|nr:PrsW family intramembrane metalloprotease [Marihabitans asiaticum]TWD13779.1 RsiW-degrading membrane proteinase PrsW (M82 family) [Marihabitans asiaticum]